MMQAGRSKMTYYWKIILILGAVVFALLWWKYGGGPEPAVRERELSWFFADGEEERTAVSFPSTVPAESGASYSFSCVLPDTLPEDTVLVFFRQAQRAVVEVGGELLYDSGGPAGYPEDAFGEYVSVWLGDRRSGERITLSFVNRYPRLFGQTHSIYLGSSGRMPAGLWEQMSAQTLLCLLMLVTGTLSVALNHIYYQTSEESLAMRYMGWFIILLSAWCLMWTRFLYLLGIHPLLLLLAENITMLLFPIPIVLAFRVMTFSEDFGKEYNGFAVFFGLFFITAAALDLFQALPLVSVAAWSLLFFGVFIIYIAVFGYFEMRANDSFDKMHSTLHSSLLVNLKESVALSVCLIASNISGRTGYQFFICACYVLVILLIGEIYKEIRALGRIREELEQSRMTLLLSQIKPHFLYNTLNSIRTLIRTDVEEADRLVYFFSRFLRSNMLLINNKDLIPFSSELNHITSYVKIEETCFPKLQVDYDIKSFNFSVPALSIQPLVENAIKHGVLKQVQGGAVHLRTWETDQSYHIEVQDDGIGFETKEVLPQTKGLGLKNIENRLKYYCKAELNIRSEPGKGTTASVRIPKKKGGRLRRGNQDNSGR